jgi:hypothetical protein
MHADDIEWADAMELWKADKNNKKTSRAGDDRSPAHRWIGSLYRTQDEPSVLALPSENLMRALMEGGAMVPVPGAKGSKTFKSQSQSGIAPREPHWPLLVDGKPVPFAPLWGLTKQPDFEKHKEAARKLGFDLFLKRAKIGQSKHVRVRPRFDEWAATGELAVHDDQITTDVLQDILESAGRYKGLGDWRPGSKTPGTFGMFTAEVEAA